MHSCLWLDLMGKFTSLLLLCVVEQDVLVVWMTPDASRYNWGNESAKRLCHPQRRDDCFHGHINRELSYLRELMGPWGPKKHSMKKQQHGNAKRSDWENLRPWFRLRNVDPSSHLTFNDVDILSLIFIHIFAWRHTC